MGRTALAAVGGSVLFYLMTNFGVWALGDGEHALYPHTVDGLIDCYWMALPFFRNALAGDVAWTAILFVAFDLANARLRAEPAAA